MTSNPVREFLIAVLLGGAGFALNMLELDLGWGMHFIFGNALIFAFLRVLRPETLVAASSIASLRSILLWNHPWAWAIWTIEAALIAFAGRRSSPIRNDVAFWVLIGTPLLLLSYGWWLEMDDLSLWLVIAKQATNGVLNVVIAEILYVGLLSVVSARRIAGIPRMPLDAFVMMILMSVILVPATLYLSIDAPMREADARRNVGQLLTEELHISSSVLGMWHDSRALMLASYARQGPDRAGALPPSLQADFDRIEAFSLSGTRLWAVGDGTPLPLSASGLLTPASLRRVTTPRLSETERVSARDVRRPALLVPFENGGARAVVVASLRANTLPRLLDGRIRRDIDGLILTNASSRSLTIQSLSPALNERIEAMPLGMRSTAEREPVLISETGYGISLMSNLMNALTVRVMPVAGLPGWQAIGVARMSDDVLRARLDQRQLFFILTGFIIFVTLLGSLLAQRMALSMRQLAQSAADLAMTGTKRDQIDSLVIRELSELSVNIATVGSQVARERGALVSYQRRLRSIAQHAPVVVYAVEVKTSDSGKLVYISEAVERLLGYTPEEAVRPGWLREVLHPKDYGAYRSNFADLRPGKTAGVEYRLRHKDGHYVWVFDSLAVETDPIRGQLEVVGSLIDISDRKLAAEQLRQADKMASLGRMVAGVAHELNQPLNFIKMAAMNLRERTNRVPIDVDRFRDKLDNIVAHVDRASAIILQMRVFGRQPSDPPRPMAVSEAVSAVLTMVGPQFEADGIRVDTSACPDDIHVLGLPVQVEQVLLNLLLNASDSIHVRQQAGDAQPGEIRIALARQGKLAILTVEDNGIGLPEQFIPVLFEPFFTTKPPKEGTGLGLSISYGIIRDLGGTIRAENMDVGARFIIELPLCD